MRFRGLFLLYFCFLSCGTTNERKNIYSAADDDRPLVDGKYSLTADRKKMEELRGELPDSRKKENDEMALILQLTSEVKRSPSEIRREFDKVVKKKRELFDKDLRKEREVVTKKEKKDRDNFLNQQADSRREFGARKHTKEENREFFRESDSRRQEYFANERERRNDFESDMRDKRKNFDDYIRAKTAEFNQEYRAYSKRFEEMKKQAPPPSGRAMPNILDPDTSDLDKEMDEIKRRQGTPLGAGE